MGGPGGGGTNPEQLFALGYAACFANAMRSAARARREAGGGRRGGDRGGRHRGVGDGRFGLAVRSTPTSRSSGRATPEDLVAKAHERCPYSNATRGNIEVGLTVRGGAAVEA